MSVLALIVSVQTSDLSVRILSTSGQAPLPSVRRYTPSVPPPPPTDLDRWRAQVEPLPVPGNPLKVPLDVFLREAGQAAGFLLDYWEPDGPRPGLRALEGVLPKSTAADIVSLVSAVQQARAEGIVAVKPLGKDRKARVLFLIAELKAALTFLLDDGVREDADVWLEHVNRAAERIGQGRHALEARLGDYAHVADKLRGRLAAIDRAFDVGLIDEALALHAAGSRSDPRADAAQARAREARTLHHQLLRLLAERVATVRWAAARVFRHHPEILRQVTSQHARRTRQAARARKKGAPP